MKQAKKTPAISKLAKQVNKIKINRKLDKTSAMEEALFFKKKMEKGEKILAIAGLPK
ncbi:hypothetical protein [Ferruginibacter sp. SUN106]|uniref:hypothetical protein n=1 Tax=Ferruginibacter sp. SUN106 TaxID=2978348 RepID=UPI003D362FF4